MTDDDKATTTGPSEALRMPPAFTTWKDFDAVEVAADAFGPIPGLLEARHTPSGDQVFLEREGLLDADKDLARQRAGVPHRNGAWWVVDVPDKQFQDKVRTLARSARRARDLAGPPGVWMTVEEAAERTPGGAEKARAWLWAHDLPRDLAGTRFVLTEEWIAALQSAPKAARGNTGGE